MGLFQLLLMVFWFWNQYLSHFIVFKSILVMYSYLMAIDKDGSKGSMVSTPTTTLLQLLTSHLIDEIPNSTEWVFFFSIDLSLSETSCTWRSQLDGDQLERFDKISKFTKHQMVSFPNNVDMLQTNFNFSCEVEELV